jgi:hypothetical protein
MASPNVTTYFAAGTLASRPATPLVAAGCMALYYATDTLSLYCYANGAWHSI